MMGKRDADKGPQSSTPIVFDDPVRGRLQWVHGPEAHSHALQDEAGPLGTVRRLEPRTWHWCVTGNKDKRALTKMWARTEGTREFLGLAVGELAIALGVSIRLPDPEREQ